MASTHTARIIRRLFTDYASMHPLLTVAGFVSLLVVPAQDIMLPLLTGRMVRAITGRDMRSLWKIGCLVVTAMAVLQLAYVGLDLVDAHLYPSMHAFFRNRIIDGVTDDLRREYIEPNVGSLLHALSVVPSTMAYWFEAGKKLLPHRILLLRNRRRARRRSGCRVGRVLRRYLPRRPRVRGRRG